MVPDMLPLNTCHTTQSLYSLYSHDFLPLETVFSLSSQEAQITAQDPCIRLDQTGTHTAKSDCVSQLSALPNQSIAGLVGWCETRRIRLFPRVFLASTGWLPITGHRRYLRAYIHAQTTSKGICFLPPGLENKHRPIPKLE